MLRSRTSASGPDVLPVDCSKARFGPSSTLLGSAISPLSAAPTFSQARPSTRMLLHSERAARALRHVDRDARRLDHLSLTSVSTPWVQVAGRGVTGRHPRARTLGSPIEAAATGR